MKLIVGLGNPGIKHEKNRHNLGFLVIDSLLKDYSGPKIVFKNDKKFQIEYAEINWQPKKQAAEKVILAKPQTYMNGSGFAVEAISRYFKIKPNDIWIIHDEIDLALGAMKIRLGGSSAGHKGVESIIEHLKTEKFWRFRLGIGLQRGKTEKRYLRAIDDFVLGDFGEGERGKSREIIKRCVKALEYALEEDIDRAMNRFNTK